MEKNSPKGFKLMLIDKKFEDSLYTFPKAEQIIIDKSNLQIQLDKFKRSVKKAFSVFDFLSIVSLWAPLFSADFKTIGKIGPEFIKGGYVTLAVLVTLYIFIDRIRGLSRKGKVSADPEEMAAFILEQCQRDR